MKFYCLDDKICLNEHQDKTIRWLITNDNQGLYLAWQAKEIGLTAKAREALKQKRKRATTKYQEDYYIAPKIMTQYNSRSTRNILQF